MKREISDREFALMLVRAEFNRLGDIAENHPLECVCDTCRQFVAAAEQLRDLLESEAA